MCKRDTWLPMDWSVHPITDQMELKETCSNGAANIHTARTRYPRVSFLFRSVPCCVIIKWGTFWSHSPAVLSLCHFQHQPHANENSEEKQEWHITGNCSTSYEINNLCAIKQRDAYVSCSDLSSRSTNVSAID